MKNLNLKNEYENRMQDIAKHALALFSDAASRVNTKIFLVGGVVRDIILGFENFDVDITVQGDAIEFAKLLEKFYPDKVKLIEEHDSFKTAKILFSYDNSEIDFDFASTRTETYPEPAVLPVVQKIGCAIEEDLKRRDFTINAMALSLNQDDFCELVDPLNGYEDLKNRIIKIIHPLSFIDDPTRIIRALKFVVRFNCSLDAETLRLQDECLNSGLFDGLCSERVKSELRQTFNLNRHECFDNFISQKIYKIIANDELNFANTGKEIEIIINKYCQHLNNKDFIWLIYLGCLLVGLSVEKISEAADKLNMTAKEKQVLVEAKNVIQIKELLSIAKDNFEVYEQLYKKPIESVLIGLICLNNEQVGLNIENYINKLKDIKIVTTGKDLLKLGVKQGVEHGIILRKILKARVNFEVLTEKEEEVFLKRLLNRGTV